MKAKLTLLTLSLLIPATPTLAQSASRQPGQDRSVVLAQYQHRPHGDVQLENNLFPPELVMAHQKAIELSSEQKSYLRQEIRNAQTRFTDLQWELQDAMESLHSFLEQERVPEQQVLAQLEKVLDLERQIKRTQMTLMVRIKNHLTPEQQARLRQLRPKGPRPPRAPQPPHPPSPPGP